MRFTGMMDAADRSASAVWRALGLLGLALLLGLTGCGGGADSATAGGTGTGTGTGSVAGLYSLVVDPSPLKAVITLDTSRQVSASLTLAGGSLSVTAADGVRYQLDIPATALAVPVTVTMTPLTSASGLPDGERSYGVQLGPDGLQFLSPAALTVTPAPGMTWPVEQQVPISLTGSDNTVSLTDLVKTSALPVFPLTHFSSYVVLLSEKGFDASVKDVRKRLGGSDEQRLGSALAERLTKERQAQLLGGTANLTDLDLAALFAEWDEKVVKVRVAAAGSSCAAGQLAFQTVVNRDRQRALLGLPDDSDAANSSLALLNTVNEVCFREEYEICRDEHIITRMLPRFLTAIRQEALLGATGQGDSFSASLLKAEDYVRKCLQFEVQLNTDMTYEDSESNFVVKESMSARIKMGYGFDFTRLPEGSPRAVVKNLGLILNTTTTPLVSESYSVNYSEPCVRLNSTQRVGSRLVNPFLAWEPGQNTPQTPGGANTVKDWKLGLVLDVSSKGSNFNISTSVLDPDTGGCIGTPQVTTEYESWTTLLGTAWYGDLLDKALDAPDVSGWQSNGNADIMGAKDIALDYSDSSNGERLVGNVRLVLFHTPIR